MNLGVIAAGDGQRLKDEGIVTPKPLIIVNGQTLLERVIVLSKKFGFESINMIINSAFRKDVEESGILEKHSEVKGSVIYGTTQSSLHSLNKLKNTLSDSNFCLMTIDSIFDDIEFESFLKHAEGINGYDGLIAVTDFVDDEKPLWIKTDENGIIKKFSSVKEGADYVTGGIYFFKKGVIGLTDKAIEKDISKLRNFLQYLVDIGLNLKAVSFSKIIDLDHKSDIEEAEKFLKKK
ncbi:MAG: NDP-sugar synthase [Ignavibacteriae bacterium]|nr:NDP-sugar synthase [Ignavibacteriota bacterium]